MIGKIQAYIEQNQMIAPGDHVVAGVSGGADSVCLLFVLWEMKEALSFTLEAVHVNHMLRKEAADDAAFVRETCERLGVAFRVFAADVGEMAHSKGISLEEAGRDYRYECLRAVAREHEAGIIAVAHHLDDRAETLLFNLFRGSGLRGLAGIRPVRDDVVRPLLFCTRQEIEEYLAARDIPYRTDPSNADEAFTRNFIRHQIMPRAHEVNPAVGRHMARTADLAGEADCFIRKQARAALYECASLSAGQSEIDIEKLHGYDIIIQKYVLLLVLEELSPSGGRDISFPHIEDVLALAQGGGSKELHLPSGLRADKEYGRLILHYPGEGQNRQFREVCEFVIDLDTPQKEHNFTVPGLGKIACRTFPAQKNMKFPQKTYTKWFDCGKITSCAVLRHKKRGDFLTIGGEGQRKKLSDYLIDEKIPRARREEMYVLADGPHIMWVCGLRISEHYKITGDTKSVLEVKLEKTADV
jgi:tRNA(Ile)-lysidine synthase